jgi:hypothetical protein
MHLAVKESELLAGKAAARPQGYLRLHQQPAAITERALESLRQTAIGQEA